MLTHPCGFLLQEYENPWKNDTPTQGIPLAALRKSSENATDPEGYLLQNYENSWNMVPNPSGSLLTLVEIRKIFGKCDPTHRDSSCRITKIFGNALGFPPAEIRKSLENIIPPIGIPLVEIRKSLENDTPPLGIPLAEPLKSFENSTSPLWLPLAEKRKSLENATHP